MFDLGLVPLDGGADTNAKVHKGYQEAASQLYAKLLPALERRAAGHVVFTGHSYGGGTSTLCALYHQPDELLTFSAPLVGDAAFARTFDATLGENRTVHLVHDADPVLQQNKPLWAALGYEHTGRVVRCSPTEPVIFGEDSSAAGGLAWNFLDHCSYLGTYLGPRAPKVRWPKFKPVYRP